MMRRLIFLFATIITVSQWAHAAPLYWENGDFKVPALEPGSFAAVDVGERYGNWHVVGEPGMVAWTSGTYSHDGFSFPAAGTTAKMTARDWVNLAAISRTATGILHDPVPTNVGKPYTLSFYVGNIVDPTGVYGTTSTVLVYENSKLLGSFTNSAGAGTKTENWQLFSVTFSADAANTSIAFINGDGPADMNCGISQINFGPMASSSAILGSRP